MLNNLINKLQNLLLKSSNVFMIKINFTYHDIVFLKILLKHWNTMSMPLTYPRRCYQAIKFSSISLRSLVDSVSLSISNCYILLPVKSYIFLNKNILFVNSDLNIRCPFKTFHLYKRKVRIFVIWDIELIFLFTSTFEKNLFKYNYPCIISFYVIVDVKWYIKSKQLLCAIFNYPLITCKIFNFFLFLVDLPCCL